MTIKAKKHIPIINDVPSLFLFLCCSLQCITASLDSCFVHLVMCRTVARVFFLRQQIKTISQTAQFFCRTLTRFGGTCSHTSSYIKSVAVFILDTGHKATPVVLCQCYFKHRLPPKNYGLRPARKEFLPKSQQTDGTNRRRCA